VVVQDHFLVELAPLAALDRGRKAEILPYLEALHRRFHLPTLYVTHDIDEVARLADRMLVLGDGRVQLHGSVASVVERMALEPMADRFEAGVVLEGQVEAHDPRLHLTRVNVAGDRLILPALDRTDPGERIRLRIRARDVSIAVDRPGRISIRNVLPGTISELTVDERAGSADVAVRLQQAHVRARVTLAAVEELELATGLAVFVLIKSVSFDGPAER
jgi:molybdate transport system ATP-binding protein